MARIVNGAVAGPLVLSLSDPLAIGGSDLPLIVRSTGTITSAGNGIDGSAGVFWTISNAGTISANVNGIVLAGGGSVTNSGTITSTVLSGPTTYGVEIGGYGAVINTGVISGYYSTVIKMGSGLVINQGEIGAIHGTGISLGTGEVVNSGSIAGGVTLDSGEIINTATIQGNYSRPDDEIGISLGSGLIYNSGRIIGSNGVDLGNNSEFVNTESGFVAAYYSSLEGGNNLTIINAGTLSSGKVGSFNVGSSVRLYNSGTIWNETGMYTGADARIDNTGMINTAYGPALSMTSGQLLNQGTIATGVVLDTGGIVVNSGIIGSGTFGVPGYPSGGIDVLSGSGTIVNTGIIYGPNQYAPASSTSSVSFASGTSNNLLVIGPKASFVGAAQATSGSNSTIELSAGTASISGIGTGQFDGFDRLSVDVGANWTVKGSNTIGTLLDNGTIAVAGSFDVSTAIDPASKGTLELTAAATLDVAAALGSGLPISFAAPSDLVLSDFAQFGTGVGTARYAGPLLEHFARGDTVDLQHFGSGGLTDTYTASSGLLQVTNGGAQKATLAFQTASLGPGAFHFASDTAGGVLITHA